jgi:ribosomal protein S18 acetylase RimI-like enzyme
MYERRPAKITDLPLIYGGEEDYIRCWEPMHLDAWRADFVRHLTRWADNFERFTIVMVEGQFAGYSLWMPAQDYAELCTINVSPAYRRRGIGQALLDGFVLDGRGEGFNQWALSVRPDNPARRLYERSGFKCVGTDTHQYLRYECHRWAADAVLPA